MRRRKIIAIPHRAYELLLQAAVRAEQDPIALFLAAKLLIVPASDHKCPKNPC